MTEETDKRPPYEKPQVIISAPAAVCTGGSTGIEIPTGDGENEENPSPF